MNKLVIDSYFQSKKMSDYTNLMNSWLHDFMNKIMIYYQMIFFS